MADDDYQMPDEEQQLKEKKISAANQAIDDFFSDKQVNDKGEPWFCPSDKIIIPKRLREITRSFRLFFGNKYWYAGGMIPDQLLFNRRNYRIVNNMTLIDAIDIGYQAISVAKSMAKTVYRRGVDTVLALGVLRECHSHAIPPDYIGGLFILYLELCEKVEMS